MSFGGQLLVEMNLLMMICGPRIMVLKTINHEALVVCSGWCHGRKLTLERMPALMGAKGTNKHSRNSSTLLPVACDEQMPVLLDLRSIS